MWCVLQGAPSGSSSYVTHVMSVYQVPPSVPQLYESADNSTRILPIDEAFGVPVSARLCMGLQILTMLVVCFC